MRVKIPYILFFLVIIQNASLKAQPNTLKYSIDLKAVVDDKLQVTLLTPAFKSDTVLFRFPRVVPGTYAIYDYGRFISELKAFDIAGMPMYYERLDDNTFEIYGGKKLGKITYWVDDTWDTHIAENIVFEAAGTDIEDGESYLINTFGFCGYFEGFTSLPVELKIKKHVYLYGTSGIEAKHLNDSEDLFVADDYDHLVDNPILYTVPDTTSFKNGNTTIVVSVHSPNDQITSKYLASRLKSLLEAQRKFIGDTLPVERYAFLVYLDDMYPRSGASGALEHSHSSFYVLPEFDSFSISQEILDIAAHEFFHILTPLTICSEEIADFNYANPKMSQHLWLYEGVVEYFAHFVQAKYGLISHEEFYNLIVDKLYGADMFRWDISMTEMSKKVMDEYPDQYENVYYKGFLIGMCLDIYLLDLSEGKYGLMNLMRDLSKEYGIGKPFKDQELFDKIVQLTYPEIGLFFKSFVAGTTPLPVAKIFEKVGLTYVENQKVPTFTIGGIELGYNPDTERLFVYSTEKMNAFGKNMGYMEGDELIAINGYSVSGTNFEYVVESVFEDMREGDILEVTVMRRDKKRDFKIRKLKAKTMMVLQNEKHGIMEISTPALKAFKTREAWIGKSGNK